MRRGGRRPEEIGKAVPVGVADEKRRVPTVWRHDLWLVRPGIGRSQPRAGRIEQDRGRAARGERLQNGRVHAEFWCLPVEGRADRDGALGVRVTIDGAAIRRELLNHDPVTPEQHVLDPPGVRAGTRHDHNVHVNSCRSRVGEAHELDRIPGPDVVGRGRSEDLRRGGVEDVDVHVVRRPSAADGEKRRVPLQHQAEAGGWRNGDALEDVAAAKVVGDTAAEARAEGAGWKHAAGHERVIV